LGKRLIRAQDVLALYPYAPQDRLLFLTCSGRLVLAPLADVPLQDRLVNGTTLSELSRDPALAAIIVPQDLL
jgi:hypothetical protein